MSELRLFDALYQQAEHYPLDKSITQLKEGNLISFSTSEVINLVNKISAGLLESGYLPGDKFSIAAFNSYQWVIVDLAAAQIGMIHVPLYPNASEEDYKYIMDQAEVKLTFAGTEDIQFRIEKASVGAHRPCYSFNDEDNVKGWKKFLKEPTESEQDKIKSIREKINPLDLATIIYTSGTTGEPKGVMLSHKNIMSNATDVGKAINISGKKYKVLSFLPLCHIFERTALYTYLYLGMSIYYPADMDNLGADMKLVKPDFFTTVPRVLEKIYEKIETTASALPPVKRMIFRWSMKLAASYDPQKSPDSLSRLKQKLADKLVFSKWREAVGNNIKFIVSGAAALQPNLVRIFTAAGIPILEAYGLTEASPGIAVTENSPKSIKPGSVGKALKSVKIKINADGEILATGPNIMMGYYLKPESTSEVVKEGWLYTGDLGTIDSDGYLYITGRKKELFKTSGGKYIAPEKIENALKASSYIDQAVVVGEDQKYPAALLVPSEKANNEIAQYLSPEKDINQVPEIRELFDSIIEEQNSSLGRYEQIKQYHLLTRGWTVETGELTPTLKVKRKVIHEKFAKEIADLFQNTL